MENKSLINSYCGSVAVILLGCVVSLRGAFDSVCSRLLFLLSIRSSIVPNDFKPMKGYGN